MPKLTAQDGAPSLIANLTEGDIIKWNFKEGDKLKPGDVICDLDI